MFRFRRDVFFGFIVSTSALLVLSVVLAFSIQRKTDEAELGEEEKEEESRCKAKIPEKIRKAFKIPEKVSVVIENAKKFTARAKKLLPQKKKREESSSETPGKVQIVFSLFKSIVFCSLTLLIFAAPFMQVNFGYHFSWTNYICVQPINNLCLCIFSFNISFSGISQAHFFVLPKVSTYSTFDMYLDLRIFVLATH